MVSISTVLGGCFLAAVAVQAAQPGAAKPVAAPMRDLTWGQLNFLHTTDTHGWLSGHLLESPYSADWGDYISFSQHIRKLSDDKGSDLLLIDTGDRIEGSGLYDGSDPKGLYQYDIYAQQKVDLISTGNHELYRAYSVDREHNTTVPNFKENYIASNLDYVNLTTGERVPQAQRFRKFKTKNQGIEIIAFGFLFDFEGNANNSFVQRVEETVKEEWFQKAIQERPDLFVVIGHVGLRMDEFKNIFRAIRKENWNTPIAFFGGHMHVRDAIQYDSLSMALASGRYMETMGWMSISGLQIKGANEKGVSSKASPSFSRKYLDNNLLGMYYHTGKNETTFPTEDGKKTSKMIEHARKALKLDHVFGCAPKDLWMNRVKYPSEDSIYTWLEKEVLPNITVNGERKDKTRLAIFNTGGIRFDIFKGAFTKDSTFTVSPFISGFRYVPDVDYTIARKVIDILNSAPKILAAKDLGGVSMPDTSILTIPQQRFRMSLGKEDEVEVDEDEDEDEQEPRLELRGLRSSPSSDQPLTVGYTTKDDVGDDGDDTVHKPLKTYPVPNCIQSQIGFPEEGEPEKVDLVFLEFIEPWIIPSLKMSGGDYTEEDVLDYMEGSFTDMLADWIVENWPKKC